MNSTFKYALYMSFVIHFILITPLYCIDLSRNHIDQKTAMVVEYITLIETPKIQLEKAVNIDETKKVALTKNVVTTKTASKANQKKEAQKKSDVKVRADDPAKKEASLSPEAVRMAKIRSSKDYINYYQLIREKIRQKLKENYRYYYVEGDCYLVFSLVSDGSLQAYDVAADKSTSDETLRHIALVSLVESSPFPAFPKAMGVPTMTFNLIVSFKKR